MPESNEYIIASNIWPTPEQVERAAEMQTAMYAQREIGHFPVDDDTRDEVRAGLIHMAETCHGDTWNATPYRVWRLL